MSITVIDTSDRSCMFIRSR